MVKLEYVHKRIRKKIVTIVALVGALVTGTFSIISFLGSRTGSFTVALENSNVSLGLTTKLNQEQPTSFLRVDDLETMDLYCYQNFKNKEGQLDFSAIDNEDNDHTMGARINKDTGEITAYKFFKFTYYLKNYGTNSADYTIRLNIINNTADTKTQKKLDGFLRAVIFVNGEKTVYAKRSTDATHFDDDPSDTSTLEYIDAGPENQSRNEGLASPFYDSTTISREDVVDFKPGEITRYTLLFWLEGDDAQATGFAPEDCKLRLGVEIQAYEN